MSLSKSYYSVYVKYHDISNDKYRENTFVFNNLELPIRFRRQESLDKFFELRVNQNLSILRLSYHDSYMQRELGDEYEFCTERTMFEVVDGKLTINWPNWSNETRDYMSKGEVCLGKLVNAELPNGNIVKVYNDKICRQLNIPYEYFDWED